MFKIIFHFIWLIMQLCEFSLFYVFYVNLWFSLNVILLNNFTEFVILEYVFSVNIGFFSGLTSSYWVLNFILFALHVIVYDNIYLSFFSFTAGAYTIFLYKMRKIFFLHNQVYCNKKIPKNNTH